MRILHRIISGLAAYAWLVLAIHAFRGMAANFSMDTLALGCGLSYAAIIALVSATTGREVFK